MCPPGLVHCVLLVVTVVVGIAVVVIGALVATVGGVAVAVAMMGAAVLVTTAGVGVVVHASASEQVPCDRMVLAAVLAANLRLVSLRTQPFCLLTTK